jgi:hypothetical protein
MRDLTPSQKGAAAEAAIAMAATRLGLPVLRPWAEGCRYDLVLDLEPRLLRVQCKLARQRSGVVVVGLRTNRCVARGYASTSYTAEQIDAVAAYVPSLDRSYLLPVADIAERRAVHLRLAPTGNRQLRGVRWAHEYEFIQMIAKL